MDALAAENVQLREQCAQTEEKLQRWKAKAKEGVDKMRQQVLDLSSELDVANAKIVNLQKELDAVRSQRENGERPCTPPASVAAATTAADVQPSVSAVSDAQADLYVACVAEKCDLLTLALADLSPLRHIAEMAENSRRQGALALRLQTKNCEALQRELQEMQARLNSSRNSLSESVAQLRSRDDIISTLEKRLEESEQRCDRLVRESGYSAHDNGRNMQQVNEATEERERAFQEIREEFESRENTIFAQHADELSRLKAAHDQELQALVQSLDARVEEAVRQCTENNQRHGNAREVVDGSSSATRRRREGMLQDSTDDAVYRKLSQDYAQLEKKYMTVLKEAEELRDKLRKSSVSPGYSSGASVASKKVGLASTTAVPSTLEESNAALQTAMARVQTLTEQTVALKAEIMQLRRDQKEQLEKSNVVAAGTLDAEQTRYLKSVLLTALRSLRDDRVVPNLLPVFATLLEFSDAEVASVYHANPSWVRS